VAHESLAGRVSFAAVHPGRVGAGAVVFPAAHSVLDDFGFMVDHWVTVLAVTDSEVIIGDPLGGLGRMSYAEFEEKWRFVGIVLRRKTPA